MIDQARTGKLKLRLFPSTGFNYVHVEDVADGILLVHDKGRIGEPYNVAGQRSTIGELVDKVSALVGRKPPRATMPPALMKAAIPVGPLVGKLLGFPPNLAELIRTSDGVTFWMSDEKARASLACAPATSTRGSRRRLGSRHKRPLWSVPESPPRRARREASARRRATLRMPAASHYTHRVQGTGKQATTRTDALRASPRMFDSNLLDFFSRVHPSVPVIIFVPAIVVLSVLGLEHVSALAFVGALRRRLPDVDALRVLAAPDRLPLRTRGRDRRPPSLDHPRRASRPSQRPDEARDASRRERPGRRDHHRRALPHLRRSLRPRARRRLRDGLPRLRHDPLLPAPLQPRGPLGRMLRELHMRHHFQDETRGFGISAPYWDAIFRTLPRRGSRPPAG